MVAYCDPPIFIPPSNFSARFSGEVVGVGLKDDSQERQHGSALVKPKSASFGAMPSNSLEVEFDGPEPGDLCAHMIRTPKEGDVLDVYLNADGLVVGWNFAGPPAAIER